MASPPPPPPSLLWWYSSSMMAWTRECWTKASTPSHSPSPMELSRAACWRPLYSAWCSLPCWPMPSVTVTSVSAFGIVQTESSSILGGCKQGTKCTKTQPMISSLPTTVHWTLVHHQICRVAWTCSLKSVMTSVSESPPTRPSNSLHRAPHHHQQSETSCGRQVCIHWRHSVTLHQY